MRTSIKPDFSVSGNDTLSGKLKQLTHEFPLSYIFYHPVDAKDSAHIVIIAEESRDVEIIESRKWIRNNKDENPILFHVIDLETMNSELQSGNPFLHGIVKNQPPFIRIQRQKNVKILSGFHLKRDSKDISAPVVMTGMAF